VAIKAQPGLRMPRERLVAFVAFRLELGMSLHQRTRHDKLFEHRLSGCITLKYQYTKARENNF